MTINNLSHNLVTPSVYSSTINLNFKHAISAKSIRLRFENVLGEIAAELNRFFEQEDMETNISPKGMAVS